MARQIKKLYDISKKESRIIVGLMSGTSLDGLDIALCSIIGSGLNTEIKLLKYECIAYSDNFKNEVKTIFSKKEGSLEQLCLLNGWIGNQHAQLVNDCLAKWNIPKQEVDFIASHGQTIYHAPKSFHQNPKFDNATLQIGDGDHIASKTGIITISDFRQKQVAAGGEGAPLASYGDYLLFRNKDKSRILINIGGIANLSYIPSAKGFEGVRSSDIGPGNTLMDTYVSRHFPGMHFDRDAAIAKKGKVQQDLLDEFKNHPFIKAAFPKTTGPELFNYSFIESGLKKMNHQELSAEDVIATLNRFTQETICDAVEIFISSIPDCEVIISGGGVHNPLLVEGLKKHFSNIEVYTGTEKGIHPDAKEAMLFALLANELIAGELETFENNPNKLPAVGMGKISLPD